MSVSLKQLVEEGYSVSRLARLFGPNALLEAGASREDVLRCCSTGALKAAGFKARELLHAGVMPIAVITQPNSFTVADLFKEGFSLTELRAIFGFKGLQSEGFTPEQLAEQGLSVRQMEGLGFSLEYLKQQGYIRP